METIKEGQYVALGYDLYEVAADGTQTIVHTTDEKNPEQFVFGLTPGMIQPLEKAVEGLSEGDKFDVTVKAADAFGNYDSEQIVALPKDLFEVDGKFDSGRVRIGAAVPMMTADGFQVMGKVLEIGSDEVKMDFNHPLAGKDVRFSGTILTVRPASAQEIAAVNGGGCGGCGGGCGDGGCCGGDNGGCDNGSCCGN
ncbi:MAG: FKBP-type peptidyl-prolyl cis-trans isomerase [Muribaculaceae bacterium]|nr:FKBP-type peptidyl-prolyl cis-trans isomerase [Muribaculaceae bacterium]MDE6510100.1 FKBP-type peptidyl-prolyl cis-trans isomerase [Muribaculaceae bacterium]